MVSDDLVKLVQELELSAQQRSAFIKAITKVAHMEALLGMAAADAHQLSEMLSKYREVPGDV
jgi:hypothetical protein